MNGKEQQDRRTAITDLTKRLNTMDRDFMAIVVQEANDRKKEDAALREEIGVECREVLRHVRELALEQRGYVDDKNREIVQAAISFIMLPWWKRYVWAVLGGRRLQWLDITVLRITIAWRNR